MTNNNVIDLALSEEKDLLAPCCEKVPGNYLTGFGSF